MEFLALPFLSLSLSLSSRNEVKVIYIYFVKIPRSTFRLNYSLIHPLSQLLILPYPTISLISFFIALLLFIRPSLLKTYAFLGICTSSPRSPELASHLHFHSICRIHLTNIILASTQQTAEKNRRSESQALIVFCLLHLLLGYTQNGILIRGFQSDSTPRSSWRLG